MPARRKRKLLTEGRLDPKCLYNSDGLLKHAGIGKELLSQARADGVGTRFIGGRNWYRGREIIKWIWTKGKIRQGEASPETAATAAGGE